MVPGRPAPCRGWSGHRLPGRTGRPGIPAVAPHFDRCAHTPDHTRASPAAVHCRHLTAHGDDELSRRLTLMNRCPAAGTRRRAPIGDRAAEPRELANALRRAILRIPTVAGVPAWCALPCKRPPGLARRPGSRPPYRIGSGSVRQLCWTAARSIGRPALVGPRTGRRLDHMRRAWPWLEVEAQSCPHRPRLRRARAAPQRQAEAREDTRDTTVEPSLLRRRCDISFRDCGSCASQP